MLTSSEHPGAPNRVKSIAGGFEIPISMNPPLGADDTRVAIVVPTIGPGDVALRTGKPALPAQPLPKVRNVPRLPYSQVQSV